MAERWASLAPWWRVLQAHELLVVSRHGDFREELRGLCVSLCPRAPSDSDDDSSDEDVSGPAREVSPQISQLRDALELALLLAVIDRSAFDQVMHAHVRNDAQVDVASVLETHRQASLTHVQLKFDVVKPNQALLGWVVAALSVFVTPQPAEDRDPAFQTARRELLRQILPSETDKHTACENLKISVGLSDSQLVPPLELMRVVETADDISAKHRVVYPFVAGRFSLYIQPSTFTSETVTQINAWLARGARLPFDRVSISSEHWPSLRHLGQALSAVFQPHSSARTPALTHDIDVVTIRDSPDRERFAQVCSTIMHTQLVRSVLVSVDSRVSLSAEEHRFRLRWVFFALFSRWATHSIVEVRLEHIQFSDADFKRLHALLLSSNPLALLFEVGTPTAKVRKPQRQVLAVKGSTMRLDLSPTRQSTGERASIKISQDMWFDVVGKELRDDGDWFVLVPAYGKCRLRRANAIQERTSSEPTGGSLGSRGIKSLQLDPPSLGEERGVFTFLRLFGQQLEAFTLRRAGSFEEENALVNMLASCSSLKRLHLPSAYPRILPQLLQAYETGACTASSLDLRYLMDQRDSPQVMRLYETLADPTQPMARTVRELLFCNRAVHWPMGDAEIAVMRAMLQNNTVLEYFERTCRPVHNEAYVALCREFNHATIATTPVAPRSKLAFLSVVSSDTASTSMDMQLDTVMITRIFDMAAGRVERRVHVGSYRSMYFH